MSLIIDHPAITISVEQFSRQITVSPDTGYRLVVLGIAPKIAGLGRNVRMSSRLAEKWIDASMANFCHLRPMNPYPRILDGDVEVLAVDCVTASQILGVSPSRMSDLVRDGKLPKLPYLQRLIRIPVCSLHGFIDHAEQCAKLTVSASCGEKPTPSKSNQGQPSRHLLNMFL